MSRGKYIVLEGPEGVGKTTQILELARRLQAAGLPVRMLREPDSQSDLTARAIRQLTQDPRYPMNTNTEVLLYNAARSQSLQVIKKSVEQGVICVVDRNYLTTLAIQYYGRGDVPDYDTINRIIGFAVNGVEPDLCIVLDAPVQILKERAHKRGQGERFDNLDDAFLERVRAGYLWEAKQRGLPVVFATDDSETIANNIWKHVTQALALRDTASPAAISEPVSVKQIIEDKKQIAQHAAEQQFDFYVPPALSKTTSETYINGLKELLGMHQKLAANAKGNVKLLASIQQTLPTACNPQAVSMQKTGHDSALLQQIAQDSLKAGYSADTSETAQLVTHAPRQEFGLLAPLLYPYTNLSADELADVIDSLGYEAKASDLQAYLDTEVPLPSALQYRWELVSDFATLQLLTTQTGVELALQAFTPRNGYAVPDEVEQAGLADAFEACFDKSLELHSKLQASGQNSPAQYVTLLGHRQRCAATIDYETLASLCKDTQLSSGLGRLLEHMVASIREVHPLVGAHLSDKLAKAAS